MIMTNYKFYLKKDKLIKKAIAKIEEKLSVMDWQKKQKLDPNLNYDLIYRLQERAWQNCFKCLDHAYDDKKSYSLGKINNLPIFEIY